VHPVFNLTFFEVFFPFFVGSFVILDEDCITEEVVASAALLAPGMEVFCVSCVLVED
jgi:hypothetical protein